MTTLTVTNNPVIKGYQRRVRRYKDRNESIRRWYQFYFVEDLYAEPGMSTIATPDARNAVDLGIYILSRNRHIDRIPSSGQDRLQRGRMNSGEKFLAGMWRKVDWLQIQRGTTAHQRRVMAMMLLSGWYAQFTALIPDPVTKEPMPVADLFDPASVFPEWGGHQGLLSAVDHSYYYSLGALREMAAVNGWNEPNLDGDDDEITVILDHWEAKPNRKSPGKPDIMHSVYVAAESHSSDSISSWPQTESMAWLSLQEPTNRRTDSKRGGFEELPYLVGPVGGVELSQAYVKDANMLMAKMGQGILAPIEGVQDAINREVSTLLQEVEAARIGQATPEITSASGSATLEPDEMGRPIQRRTGEQVSYPHAFTPELAGASILMNFLQDVYQRATFPWTGQAPITASGVAIEKSNEMARSHLAPYRSMGQHIYEMTDYIWLRDYTRRWGSARVGRIRLQGSVMEGQMAGFFDEEFAPADMPETHYVNSDIPWGLVEDDMMKANIAVQLSSILSQTWVRENVLHVQDDLLEQKRRREDSIGDSPFMVNADMASRVLPEMIMAARDSGTEMDSTLADILTIALGQLMQSLAPQQGRGIPERPGQGSPEAGGVMNNAGGGRPELSPANRPPPTMGEPEAPAGGGTLEQAARNV